MCRAMAALSVITVPFGSSRVGTCASGFSDVSRFCSVGGLPGSRSSTRWGRPESSSSASAMAEPQPGFPMSVYMSARLLSLAARGEQSLGLGQILRPVGVEERVDVGDRKLDRSQPMARRPDVDLVNLLDRQRMAEVV